MIRRWLAAAIVSWCAAAQAAPPRDMVLVPAGPFIMGSERVDARRKGDEYGSIKPFYVDERPQRRIVLPAFYIDKYEVTNSQYRDFVRAANYAVPEPWKASGYLLSREILNFATLEKLRQLGAQTYRLDADTSKMNREQLLQAIERAQSEYDSLPVTGVKWQQAHDYCRWAAKRLPGEAEWEKAARGTDGREYPWGNTWDAKRLNGGGSGEWEKGVAPVGSYPAGASPYGVLDMAGNVMEWVQDWYGPYPGNTWKSDAYGKTYKVVRGGGWGGVGHYAIDHFYRTAYRLYLKPDSNFTDIGFRCAQDAARS